MPVRSAIWDIVTLSRPRSATSAAVVIRIACRTSRRCVSIVSFHSFGTTASYGIETLCLDKYTVSRKLSLMADTPRWVKIMGIVVAVLIVLFLVVLALPIEHGP